MKKPQLFLLHFAGGNYYSFYFMAPFLKDFEIVPLELPGRGKRMEEDLLRDFDSASRDIFNQISSKLNGQPFFIYGHSMGASLGFRVSNMLEKAKTPAAYLIVSGNPGPGMKSNCKRYLLPSEDFKVELKKLGGVPTELIENKELLDFFEPILRADFEIAERNELEKDASLNIPVYAVMGSEEEKAGEITNWRKFTQSKFKFELLEGDHFFIHKHPVKMARIIKNCYDEVALL